MKVGVVSKVPWSSWADVNFKLFSSSLHLIHELYSAFGFLVLC
jgi:hypothetical protein